MTLRYSYEASSPPIHARISQFTLSVNLSEYVEFVDCDQLAYQLKQIDGFPTVSMFGQLWVSIGISTAMLHGDNLEEMTDKFALEVTRLISRHIAANLQFSRDEESAITQKEDDDSNESE